MVDLRVVARTALGLRTRAKRASRSMENARDALRGSRGARVIAAGIQEHRVTVEGTINVTRASRRAATRRGASTTDRRPGLGRRVAPRLSRSSARRLRVAGRAGREDHARELPVALEAPGPSRRGGGRRGVEAPRASQVSRGRANRDEGAIRRARADAISMSRPAAEPDASTVAGLTCAAGKIVLLPCSRPRSRPRGSSCFRRRFASEARFAPATRSSSSKVTSRT